MSVAVWLGGFVLLSLTVYCLTGGADFGGGVWDLFARGPRAEAQRKAIRHAIGPIWEANHVWLIAVIVLLFVGFPKVYAALGTLLHVPLTLMLVGIVLRGSAFIFRSYGDISDRSQRFWELIFSTSSTITPVMLGISLGAVISGQLPVAALGAKASARHSFVDIYVTPWLQAFPVALGFFVLALFAFLAAVYLCVEVEDPALQQDFRARALGAGVAVFALAWLCFDLSTVGAPMLADGLARQWWSLPFQLFVGVVSMGAMVALWQERFLWARALAIVQVGSIVLGWGMAQYPYLIVPHLTLQNSAAPDSVLWPVAVTFTLGALVLVPAFGYLYYTVKDR